MIRFFIQLSLIIILAVNWACDSSKNADPNNNLAPAKPDITNSEQVALCDLVKEGDRFDGREVRINAVLITGFEYTYLYDPACMAEKQLISYRIEGSAVNNKLERIINPENPEYATTGFIRVNADFSGIFETKKDKGFGPDGFFNYELTIRAVDNVSSVPRDVPYP